MAYQTVFERCELKFLLTCEQKRKILEGMAEYMALDGYGRTIIRNIYYDTENYRLVRHSIEKPVYKEKLRIRSYQQANPDSPVFVELKKKYNSVVYKRRLSLRETEAMEWVGGRYRYPGRNQISQEIEYFLSYYQTLQPVVFLSYEREAYYSRYGDDFRVTFDENILGRQEDLSLQAAIGGRPVLEEGTTLMEIKCDGGIPLWMTRLLTEQRLYKTSFSKYGAVYQTLIFPQRRKEAVSND